MDKIIIYLVFCLIASVLSYFAQKYDTRKKEHQITGKIRNYFLDTYNYDISYIYWF